MSAIVDALCAH